jgi:hypothetical protein
MALGSHLSYFSRPAATATRSKPKQPDPRLWEVAAGAALLAGVLLLAWGLQR